MTPGQKMITAAVENHPHDELELVPSEPEPPCLDEDLDTSMVESVTLHLISEHSVSSALHLNKDEATARHLDIHEQHPVNHRLADLRFRPARILAILDAASQQHEAVQRLVGPGLPVQPLRT